jgi:hypothetical protein
MTGMEAAGRSDSRGEENQKICLDSPEKVFYNAYNFIFQLIEKEKH